VLAATIGCGSDPPSNNVVDAGADVLASTTCSVLGPVGIGAGGQCTVNFTSCSDAHGYRVNCTGTPIQCTCEIDGTIAKVEGTSPCSLSGAMLVSTINQGCGWSLTGR
jgi:hypothetical protein